MTDKNQPIGARRGSRPRRGVWVLLSAIPLLVGIVLGINPSATAPTLTAAGVEIVGVNAVGS